MAPLIDNIIQYVILCNDISFESINFEFGRTNQLVDGRFGHLFDRKIVVFQNDEKRSSFLTILLILLI